MRLQNKADLHIHTSVSDSSSSPADVVRKAYKLGYKAIAITDHDTMKGVDEARKEANKYGIEIIPGVELTAYYYNHEMHILAYFIEPDNNYFSNELKKFRDYRFERAKEIVKKLNSIGVKIDYDTILNGNKMDSIARPHIAKAIVEGGYAKDMKEAFEKYLIEGRPAYVPKYMISPKEIIEIILNSGGVPVFAHPIYYFNVDNIIDKLVKYGLKGIEVYHSMHSLPDRKKFKRYAEKYGLIITGGSDCHGDILSYLGIGKTSIPYFYVKKLRQERDKIRFKI